MQRNRVLKIAITAIFVASFAIGIVAFAKPAVQEYQLNWDWPRLDELFMIEGYPRGVAQEKALACDIDMNLGMIVADDVRELEGLGWGISQNPGYHMCYGGPNCRDYTPDSSGVYWDYHGRTPGFSLYPLNISGFRLALELIIGCEKDAWIAEIYEFINVRLDASIPPANAFWYNPYIPPYPEDPAKAETILLGAGFTWDKGADATGHTTDDIWYCPNGMKLIGGPDSTSPGSDRLAGWDDVGTPIYGMYVMPPGDALAPTSHELCLRHTRKWNQFFMGANVSDFASGGLFEDEPMDLFDPLILVPFYNRDHDIYWLCWGLSQAVDYLYDFFHPDMDIAGANNTPGIDNEPLNQLIYSLKFWIMKDYDILKSVATDENAINVGDFPAGKVLPGGSSYDWGLIFPTPTPLDIKIERVTQELGVYYEYLVEGVDYVYVGLNGITLLHDITLYPGDALEVNFPVCQYQRNILDINEMREYVWLINWKLYVLCPYLPMYSRNYINAFKPGLTCWVDSLGYGSADDGLPWTYSTIHWDGVPVGGSVKWHLSGDVTTLNPFKVGWVYEAIVYNRMYDGMSDTDPYTQEQIPWCAVDWKMIPWTSEDPYVPNGMIIKIWLRNDIYWQSGEHVTAEDVKWNFDFINSTQAPEFYNTHRLYMGADIIHDYCIKLYINATGLWFQNLYLGGSLAFPRAVWEPFWGDYTGASTWDPWNVRYEDWTGCSSPFVPDLTCLFGTGPWVLDFWNEVDTAHVIRNPIHHIRRTAIQPSDFGPGSKQTGAVYSMDQCYKIIQHDSKWEFDWVPIPPYPLSIEEPLSNPVGHHMMEKKPDMGTNARVIDWMDNGNGYLDFCDEIILDTPDGPMIAHVEDVSINMWVLEEETGMHGVLELCSENYYSFIEDPTTIPPSGDGPPNIFIPVGSMWEVEWPTGHWPLQECSVLMADWIDFTPDGMLSAGDAVFLDLAPGGHNPTPCIVTRLRIGVKLTGFELMIPKITHPFLYVLLQNPDAKAECEMDWILTVDGIEIASGTQIVNPASYYRERISLEDIYGQIPTCVHDYNLTIITATGKTTYISKMAITIGDVNCDSVVDMKDIFAMILAFGTAAGDPRWDADADINEDGVVDMKDIFSYGIINFGKSCGS
jgi:ABC-type transport system substrate-binding protein